MRRYLICLLLIFALTTVFAESYAVISERYYNIRHKNKVYKLYELKYLKNNEVITEYRLDGEVSVICVSIKNQNEKESKLSCDFDANGEIDAIFTISNNKEVSWISNNIELFRGWFK